MELDKEKEEGKACFLAFLLISMMHGGAIPGEGLHSRAGRFEHTPRNAPSEVGQ